MAVPKRRKSKSKVRTKRAHHAIGKPNLAGNGFIYIQNVGGSKRE